jgi:hypothetical protein
MVFGTHNCAVVFHCLPTANALRAHRSVTCRYGFQPPIGDRQRGCIPGGTNTEVFLPDRRLSNDAISGENWNLATDPVRDGALRRIHRSLPAGFRRSTVRGIHLQISG